MSSEVVSEIQRHRNHEHERKENRFETLLVVAVATLAVLFSSCDKLILGPDDGKSPPPAQHASRFETVLDSLRYALDLPALAGAIMTDTGIVEAAAIGCRRYGGEMNVTVDDEFYLGSCGKSFTAVLIGLLVDEGKLNWNTTLPEVFPEYAETMRPEYKEVTVRDLLSHGAGFIRDPDLMLHAATPRAQRVEVVAWAVRQLPAVHRGTELYSNLGFIIAGAIAERIADSSYEDLITNRIVHPLGLTTAGFGTMGTDGLEDQPLQHTPSHAPLEATADAHLQDIYDPAGGLYMSIRDWARYCRWVLACEAGHATLLSQETARTITTPVLLSPGGGGALGWGVEYAAWIGGRVLTHTGSNGFNYAEVLVCTDRDYGVIVMTNQGSGSPNNPLAPAAARLVEYHFQGR